jgi:hypothetical protein
MKTQSTISTIERTNDDKTENFRSQEQPFQGNTTFDSEFPIAAALQVSEHNNNQQQR